MTEDLKRVHGALPELVEQMQAGAVDRADDGAALAALDRIGHGDRRNRGRRGGKCVERAVDHFGRHERPRGVVDQHQARC